MYLMKLFASSKAKEEFDINKVKHLSREEVIARLKEENENEDRDEITGVFQNFDDEDLE